MLISYAQNFEDVILWRALKHVDRGFYIDIGAQDPVIDSVSLVFYENGWRGVHVEPLDAYAEKLRRARPDERVIQTAIGTSARSIPFSEFTETGLSTGNPGVAMMHQRHEGKGLRIEVPCMRLSRILSDYRDRDVHWLKIDVEGMERGVIESWHPAEVRPWIVLVAGTKPNSSDPAFADWEPLLAKLGYEFVYFDGLSRFYTSDQHPELRKSFGPGPNYFDGFVLSEHSPFCARSNAEPADELRTRAAVQTEAFARAVAIWENAHEQLKQELSIRDQRIDSLSTSIKSLEADLRASNEARVALEADLRRAIEALASPSVKSNEAALLASKLKRATAALDAVYGSTSWRITAPLRGTSHKVRWFVRGSCAWLSPRPAYRLRSVLARLKMMIWPSARHEPLQNFVQPHPSEHVQNVGQLNLNEPVQNFVQPNPNIENSPDLSARARRIYDELKAAIASRQGSP